MGFILKWIIGAAVTSSAIGAIYDTVFHPWGLCGKKVHSNLGGFGPDDGPEQLRVMEVGNIVDFDGVETDQKFDLVIETLSGYMGKSEENGVIDCIGKINVIAMSEVDLLVSLVYTGTSEPIPPTGNFFFTIYDMDQTEHVQKSFTVHSDITEYVLGPNSEVLVSDDLGFGTTFTSSTKGSTDDHPTDLNALTDIQKSRAVTLYFTHANEFEFTMRAPSTAEGKKAKGTQTFMFGGKSEFVRFTKKRRPLQPRLMDVEDVNAPVMK